MRLYTQLRKEEKQKAREKGNLYKLKVEFQGIARRDKKVFLNKECKEIEEKNRMGNTRDLQENWRIKGTFHGRMGGIKDRNGKDLTEAEEIKKRWQEYTEELYKTRSMTQIATTVWSFTYSLTSWSQKSSGP